MSASSKPKFSANEQSIQELQQQNDWWIEQLFFKADEVYFLEHYLSADIFRDGIPNLFEKLELFKLKLESLRLEMLDLNKETHNHRFNLEGMLECDDVSCDSFYHEEHLNLEKRVNSFLNKFREFRSEVFNYSAASLKTRN